MFGWFNREPKSLIERRQQMLEALADYPLYETLHRQGPNGLRQAPGESEEEHIRLFGEFVARGRENFDHFMEQRPVRLAALRALLRGFGVSATLQDDGLAAVSNWLTGNASALVPDLRDRAAVQAFYQMQTPWTRERRGFNLIFDLGIFLGECLIERQPRLHWTFSFGASDDGQAASTGYTIEGYRREKKNFLDPPHYIFGTCWNELTNIRSGGQTGVTQVDVLVGVVRDFSTR